MFWLEVAYSGTVAGTSGVITIFCCKENPPKMEKVIPKKNQPLSSLGESICSICTNCWPEGENKKRHILSV